MNARSLLGTLLLAALAAPAHAVEPDLVGGRIERRTALDPAPVVATLGIAAPEWVGWSVVGVPEAAELCCPAHARRESFCSLAAESGGWGSDRAAGEARSASDLLVLVEVERGRAVRILTLGAACPVRAEGRSLLWLDGVDPERSLAWLGTTIAAAPERIATQAVAALAHHAAPGADQRLAALARDPNRNEPLREGAIFWAGAVRGSGGYELLASILDDEPDGDLRQHALFALTLSPAAEALPRLRRAATSDREPEVRGQALFWLAQTDDPRAAGWILAAIEADAEREVREQGVFALSQLDDGTSQLVRLLRESSDRDIRRQALFWLGQAEDPRALAALEEVLGAEPR